MHAAAAAPEDGVPLRYVPAAHCTHDTLFVDGWYRPLEQLEHTRFEFAVGARVW